MTLRPPEARVTLTLRVFGKGVLLLVDPDERQGLGRL